MSKAAVTGFLIGLVIGYILWQWCLIIRGLL